MAKYSSYAEKIKGLTKVMDGYEEARAAYEAAKKEAGRHPIRTGWGVTPDELSKAYKAAGKLKEAEAAFSEAKKSLEGLPKTMEKLRSQLAEEVTRDLQANPADLDRATVDLLTSGICKPEEIRRLYDEAKTPTTKRYIAKYAEQEAKKVDGLLLEEGERNRLHSLLSGVASDGKNIGVENSEAIQAFDVAGEVVQRISRNPSMIKYFDSLTEDALSVL